jgi:hypothetical protein
VSVYYGSAAAAADAADMVDTVDTVDTVDMARTIALYNHTCIPAV